MIYDRLPARIATKTLNYYHYPLPPLGARLASIDRSVTIQSDKIFHVVHTVPCVNLLATCKQIQNEANAAIYRTLELTQRLLVSLSDHPGDFRYDRYIEYLEEHFIGVLNMLETACAEGPEAITTEILDRFTSNQNQATFIQGSINPRELPDMLLFARHCLQYADNFPGEPCMRVAWKTASRSEDEMSDEETHEPMYLMEVDSAFACLDIPVSIQFDINDRCPFIMRRYNGRVEPFSARAQTTSINHLLLSKHSTSIEETTTGNARAKEVTLKKG